MALMQVNHKTCQQAKEALCECFDPPSKREPYKAQLQCRIKQDTENWIDFGEELRVLVDRAYPNLQDEARGSIALTRYLDQIKSHQITFRVRQQHPKSLVEAVRATIELESYLPKNEQVAPMQGVASVRDNQSLVSVIEKLTDHVEKLEGKLNDRTVSRKQQQPSHRPQPDYRQPVICHRCG